MRQRAGLGTALAVVAFLTFFLGPFFWQVLTSLWPDGELTRSWPSHLTLESYVSVLWGRPFLRVVLNSLVVAALTTVFCLVIGSAAAFALAKLEFRGKGLLLSAALAVSMFPPIATVSPLYLILRAVGLRDSLVGLALPYATFAMPLTLWVLTSFFRQLPDELYRAARVDGCTPFQAFRRVLLPLAAPGLATTAILVFIFAWNEFLFALTFLTTPEKRTVPVAISLFASEYREPWGEIAAASVVATLPLVVLTVLFQRRIVSGLTAGAVKE
ncbi:carbohydrate ABC transporter permease [Myxococcus qinghaiensis]|uniref:carbohydrate ABC transporter permease n=1 Tax=Myxococcus qinghaiensis TaxID=2906758 RepID=UPI0020A815B4|nr:carbohydrate ABC transporter permease [Myxococcus qinghaiensis]MCP3169376.1 carbohydrate ABC transporter permease [Myxococcus qinghaiensis]